jgi:exonuclease III
MRIATWNSRGTPAGNVDKMAVLDALKGACDIIVLQECGTLTAAQAGVPAANFYSAPPAGAFNVRCSSCILARTAFTHTSSQSLASSSGRSVMAVAWSNYVVATLHAAASGAAAFDGSTALTWLVRTAGNMARIILGGDFNAEPMELSNGKTRSKTVGTSSRGVGFHIASPGGATHTNGRTLDYYIHTPAVRMWNTAPHHLRGGSDHVPVLSDFEPTLRGG